MEAVVTQAPDRDATFHKLLTRVQQEKDDNSRHTSLNGKSNESRESTAISGQDPLFPGKAKECKKPWPFLSAILSCVCGGDEVIKSREELPSGVLPNAVVQQEVPKSRFVLSVTNEEKHATSIPNFEPNTEDPALVDTKHLLGPTRREHAGRKCLVLDLDETLVHTSFEVVEQADFIIPVEIEGQYHNAYILKRPGVDEFLREVGKTFEIVVFTASLSKYADPVLDTLDVHKVVHYRLFRESCYNYGGNYVKDLSQLGRDLSQVIILDNSPASYIFHPANAVPVSSWFNDPHDTELLDLVPLLEDLAEVEDVTLILDTLIDASRPPTANS
ncbi:NIF-domain-containing protein [Basidiobolus meristosporus CBS 931.73]|uniref:NIF-domain-containing protein n=1 Tax=Basidiobolus meristosporus CBS 931.73 TaxID=1314790 RepID=A0A1Y1Y166_9FUNG|nr:NIF-domain-containing protein [Basidiobolus meristosporus CBS 931.73]|eukprot:ORX91747.1 NIF-domain-containing protein [Basidiobolus meristosporus CBS 931.73]